MNLNHLALCALLAFATVAILPQPAAATDPCDPVCLETDLNICRALPEACAPVCEQVIVPSDPTTDPTTVTCIGGTPCGCACPVVGTTFHAEAAGQEIDGWLATVIPPLCGVGGSVTLTPGPVNATGPVGACADPWVAPFSLDVGSACLTANPSTGCVGVAGSLGDLSPIITAAIDTSGLPPVPNPACVDPCSVPDPGVGGVVGDTVAYAQAMDTIACTAAAALVGVAGEMAAATTAYAEGQLAATTDWLCQEFCTPMPAVICNLPCTIQNLLGQVPPFVTDYASAVANTAATETGGQLGTACTFLIDHDVCNAFVAGPAGTCVADIPRDNPGVVGATEAYAGAACDMAQGGADQLAAATGTFAAAAEDYAEAKVNETVAEATALAESAETFAGERVADAEAYAGTMEDAAGDAVGAAGTAVISSCAATTTFIGLPPCK